MYRCEAVSIEGFIQQLAVSYLSNGYWFYVPGQIPENKDPEKTDRKIISQYGIDVSKFVRARRKKAGLANLQYLRYRNFFVLLATPGVHEFFRAEAKRIHDAREAPIRVFGYSISVVAGREGDSTSIRIEREKLQMLRSFFVSAALGWSVEKLVREIISLPFEPYAPVRRQVASLIRAVNRKRTPAGLEPVPPLVAWRRRAVVRPFSLGASVEESRVSNPPATARLLQNDPLL